MLKLLTLENFKAFGKRTEIELAPITLIFGENSAGKSSILQSLNLLKQTYESPHGGGALLPRAESGFIDLGSFNELLFDHDTSRKLRIGLQMSTDSRNPVVRNYNKRLGPQPLPGIEIVFQRLSPGGDVTVAEIELFDSKHDRIAHFNVRAATEREARRAPYFSPNNRYATRETLFIAECDDVTSKHELWEPIYRAWFERRDVVVSQLQSTRERYTSDPHSMTIGDIPDDILLDDLLETKKTPASLIKRLDVAIRFYSREFTLEQFMKRFQAACKKQSVPLLSFLPTGPMRMSRSEELPEIEATYRHARHARAAEMSEEFPNFDAGLLAAFAGRSAASVLRSLFPMGPIRKPPERWYIFTGTSPRDVGYKGDHLPDLLFRKKEYVDAANLWLEKLDIGYKLDPRALGERNSDLFELRLVDTRRDEAVDVALSDVGFGISQILPFIVQSLASNRQIISIEQPEVHIHPRLQADLGDLVAHAIQRPYFHQYLIETHSEHLILRIQRLIREKELKASDVSVLFVSRGDKDGSDVQRLRLDESGDFIDDWPGGFFSERLRELR